MLLPVSLLLLGLSAVAVHAKVQFLGVGIAGGDFGCTIDGSCPTGSVQLPLTSLGGGDGQGQMNHWAQSGLNMFRLPVSWQFLVNNQLGGTLNAANLGRYDQLVQACLATGAHCMIDVHNFARWNGGIIGQGGPSDDDFVGLWRQIATKYAASDRVVFELMNEPHDLDVSLWAQTCQKVVTAIRTAGATSQMILLPGTNFDSAATLVSSGSADALMAIRNPDGSTDGLLLDIHKYLDVDNSGTHRECTTDNREAFLTVADYLRKAGRKGLVSETGASSDASCMTNFCAQNALINENSDVFVGLVGWAAGSFSTSYILSLTPTKNGNTLVDNALMTQCVINTWLNSKAVQPSVSVPQSSAAATSSTPATLPPASSPPASSSPATSPRTSSASSAAATTPITPTSAGLTQPTAIFPGIAESTMVIGTDRMTMPTTLLKATGSPSMARQPSPAGSPTGRNGTTPAATPTPTVNVVGGGALTQPSTAGLGLVVVAVVAAVFL